MTLDDPIFYLEIAELFLSEAALRESPNEAVGLLKLGEHYLELADACAAASASGFSSPVPLTRAA